MSSIPGAPAPVPTPDPMPVGNPTPKPVVLAGWKTILINLGVAMLAGGVAYAQKQDWVDILPKDQPMLPVFVTWALNALNIALRTGTYTSVFKSTSPAPSPPSS